MIRRKFLQMMTIAGGLASLEAVASGASQTVAYRVRGFSCLACATGLDTLLGQQKGILASKSTYPEGKVMVRFNPARIQPPAIVAFIAELGFTVMGEIESGAGGGE